MGTLSHKEPHPECGSSDGLARYVDGTGFCWACSTYVAANGAVLEQPKYSKPGIPMVTTGRYEALEKRKITEATCEKWGYQLGEYNGTPVQIANYRDQKGALVAQKLRKRNKEFVVTGNGKAMPMYGQWLWRDGGKSVVIVEGEIDALSMSQAFDNKWAVVSLPYGAPAAPRAVKENLEWLSKFESIVLMFDMDQPGRDAVDAVKDILPAGKVKFAKLPEKDANETLMKHGPKALVDAFWSATSYRPDGIVSGADFTVATLRASVEKGFELPYPKLNQMMLGLRKRELTMLTAGSGIGKSTWAREIAFHMHQEHGLSVGNVFLEENNAQTAQAYVALYNNVPLGRLRANGDLISPSQWELGLSEVVHKRMWFYNHFGSLESENLLSKLEYMAALGVDFIFLDHISIVVSGQESSSGGERKDIDILMTRLQSLIQKTGVGIVGIVHLNQPEGKPHEEGARVTLRHLRGSGSLKQLSNNVLALERDQQGTTPTQERIRVLKCRELGETGEADMMNYDRETGRLVVMAEDDIHSDVSNADDGEDCPF